MKLRRESAENGDFSGPKGEFKKLFSGRNRIEIPSGRKIVFWTEKAPLSALAVAGFMKYAGYGHCTHTENGENGESGEGSVVGVP